MPKSNPYRGPFFTGLTGERERAARRFGLPFFVFELGDSFAVETTEKGLRKRLLGEWMGWVAMLAESEAAALRRYDSAHRQWEKSLDGRREKRKSRAEEKLEFLRHSAYWKALRGVGAVLSNIQQTRIELIGRSTKVGLGTVEGKRILLLAQLLETGSKAMGPEFTRITAGRGDLPDRRISAALAATMPGRRTL